MVCTASFLLTLETYSDASIESLSIFYSGIALAFQVFETKFQKGEVVMKRKKQILTAILLSGSVGLGAQSLFAQSAPGGGPSAPSNPGTTGPTVPQPGPGMPQEMQPTIPGQPAPGLPQTWPFPGQPGTIPERIQPPEQQGSQGRMVVTPDDIKSAQRALRAQGLNPGTDGQLDTKTQQALRDFQKSNNLPATGVLDEKTAQKLGVTLDGQSPSLPERERGDTMPRSNRGIVQ